MPNFQKLRFILFISKIFCFFFNINYIKCICERENPILLNNDSCISKYCTNEEFNAKECIINNEIIKTQWITNYIVMEPNFRFGNLALFSNGDIILETSESPYTSKRFFFALKQNGRNYFENENQFYFLSVYEKSIKARYYSELFPINITEENKEYIVNIGRGTSFVEIYDFDLNKTYIKETAKIFKEKRINSMRETSFKIISDNNIYTIFPALLRTTNGSTFSLNKLNFSSIYINEIDPIVENYEETEENAKGDLVSCFETDENIIICFYNCFYGKIFGHCISSFNYTFEKLN